MKTRIGYVYDCSDHLAPSRYYTGRFDPNVGKLIEIVITVLDDDNKVVKRYYYKVEKEETDA